MRIVVNAHSIHIENSFTITNDKEKLEVLNELFKEHPEIASSGRTVKNMFYEWKAHNILYQKNYEIERTKSVDFELNQKWWLKIAYWLIAHFGKEQQI